jgi:hypothetical protein
MEKLTTYLLGQHQCLRLGRLLYYDAGGVLIDCEGTGQDGGYQKGVEWPEPRFSDHDDGTVTDNLTGLMWFKDTQYFEATMNWQNTLDA